MHVVGRFLTIFNKRQRKTTKDFFLIKENIKIVMLCKNSIMYFEELKQKTWVLISYLELLNSFGKCVTSVSFLLRVNLLSNAIIMSRLTTL